MNVLQKTMPELILQQRTNTTEHHEYVTENNTGEENSTEHHAYVTENHDRDDFTTEHKYHRTPWICYRKTSEKKLQKKTDQPASDITILATHQSILNSGEP